MSPICPSVKTSKPCKMFLHTSDRDYMSRICTSNVTTDFILLCIYGFFQNLATFGKGIIKGYCPSALGNMYTRSLILRSWREWFARKEAPIRLGKNLRRANRCKLWIRCSESFENKVRTKSLSRSTALVPPTIGAVAIILNRIHQETVQVQIIISTNWKILSLKSTSLRIHSLKLGTSTMGTCLGSSSLKPHPPMESARVMV